MKDRTLRRAEDLAELVEEVGFLPLFAGAVPGLSVEEHTPPELWFTELEGPWQWKGPAIQLSGCAYGKFFGGKAGFISRAWFPDFANYRRDGYDFDARYEDGLATLREKLVYDTLAGAGEEGLLSADLRRRCGMERKHFEPTLTKLQGSGYLITTNFEYALSAQGLPYGIARARYALPELYFGAAFTETVYAHAPEESRRRLLEHLKQVVPGVREEMVWKMVGGRG